jgi:hypothetical protein
LVCSLTSEKYRPRNIVAPHPRTGINGSQLEIRERRFS